MYMHIRLIHTSIYTPQYKHTQAYTPHTDTYACIHSPPHRKEKSTFSVNIKERQTSP